MLRIFGRNKKRAAHLAVVEKEKARRFRRRILGLPVIGWIILGVSGAALAIVGLMVILGTSGSITASEDKINMTYKTAMPIVVEEVGLPDFGCAASYVDDENLNITISDASPGDQCHIVVAVQNTGPATARLNGFELASPGFAGFITASVDDCGRTVTSALPNSGNDVGFWIEIGAVTSAQVFSFNPVADGLDWRANPYYVAGECTVHV